MCTKRANRSAARVYGLSDRVELTQQPREPVAFMGLVVAAFEDRPVLESIGIDVDDFDPATGGYHCKLTVSAFERLEKLPGKYIYSLVSVH